MNHGSPDVVDELILDELAAVVDGVEDFADGDGRHGMLADQLQPLLILRRRRVFHPEQAVGLEALAEACRLDGRQPMMYVVQGLDAAPVLLAARVEPLPPPLEHFLWRPPLPLV